MIAMRKLVGNSLLPATLVLLIVTFAALTRDGIAVAKSHGKPAARVLVCLSPDDIRSVEMAYRNSRRGDGTKGLPEGYRAIELDREDAVCLLSKLVGALHGNPPTPRVTFPH